jgi:hypothetical protein
MKIYLIFLIGLILYINYYEKYQENFGNYNFTCSNPPELLQTVMKERGMKEDAKDYDIHVPCNYDSCEKDILAFENKKGKKVFFIDGCDFIGSKLALWDLLREKYGKEASKYMPTTFLLENENERVEFPKHYYENKKKRPDQMYVLKNYEQRQEGIKLTRDLDEIMEGRKHGWYLVQDYVYNPYIISKRKINFRYYMLVVCMNGKISAYAHKDGFLYYTPEFYDEKDMKFDKHITTGYIDRQVYVENPLTLQDFRDHLEEKQKGLSKVWDASAENLLNKVMSAISMKICKNKKLDNNVRFQLFGCDVAPDSKLGCTLMEINKGPDMDAKDERDKMVKLQVQRDILKIVDPIDNDTNTRFVKIF